MSGISDRQQRMLAFIQEFIQEHGYPPTIREIGRKLGISSTSVVNYNLNKLKTAGLLDRDGQVSRGLKLRGTVLEVVSAALRIPVLGTIAAGQPIPVLDQRSAETADDWLEVTQDIVRSHDHLFALHVKGNSMIDALIHDGDIVVMERSETAENGQMVAAWIKDREETTLKRFYRENGRVRLQPANPTMQPIFVDPNNVEVQGKVVAVIRNLA
jgi:repressor LexA